MHTHILVFSLFIQSVIVYVTYGSQTISKTKRHAHGKIQIHTHTLVFSAFIYFSIQSLSFSLYHFFTFHFPSILGAHMGTGFWQQFWCVCGILHYCTLEQVNVCFSLKPAFCFDLDVLQRVSTTATGIATTKVWIFIQCK